MIIKEIRFSDFLVFDGEQVIQFPTKNEHNLTIILAPNNSGKTSIIRSLAFLFSGRVPGTATDKLHELIHANTKESTKVGSQATGWVEITIEQEDSDLCLRRTILARKLGETVWRTLESTLSRVTRGSRVSSQPDDKGLWQRKLRTLVPEDLFDAFYFKGEPLEGKLLGGVGNIRDSLASFLHENQWEEVETALENLLGEYTEKLRALMARNVESRQLLEDDERLQRFLREQEKLLSRVKTCLAQATEEYEQADNALHEIGQKADTEELLKKLRQTRQARDVAIRARDQTDVEIIRLLGSSRGLPFLGQAIPKARTVLTWMEDQNLLPADITEGFVERLIKAPRCICGRQHDDESRQNWEKYKERTFNADLNSGLNDLLNAIGDGATHGYPAVIRDLHTRMPALIAERSKQIEQINELDPAIKEMELQAERSPLPDIQRISLQLRTLTTTREKLQRDVAQYETAIKPTRTQLAESKRKMEKARGKERLTDRGEAIQRARQRTTTLLNLVTQSRAVLGKAFHEILQRSVSEYYDKAVYDRSRAKVHHETLLPAIEVNGQVQRNLGGGQSQLLALAYIVSLARLRKQLHDEMQALGISFGRVYDQSFFLDSPFNQVTDTYARAIAKFLCTHARQTVVLVARQQWTETIQEILEPQAEQIYALKYFTLADKIKNLEQDDFVYPVKRTKINLLSQITDGSEHPKTKILTLT